MTRTASLLLVVSFLPAVFAGCSVVDAGPEGAVVAEGTFAGKEGVDTSGSFYVERLDDGALRLVLAPDFRTEAGPDLHVVLAPTTAEAAHHDNALADGAVIVGRLARSSGKQQYDLRDDTPLDAFRSVLIHCIEYSHLFGAAPLR